MDDIQLVKNEMASLIEKIELFKNEISKTKPAFIAFDIQKITKEDEKHFIHKGIDFLQVNELSQWNDLHIILNSFSDFYRDISLSTKFVQRMPGIIVVNENKELLISMIDAINLSKAEIANIVRNGRNSKQKHEFIHSVFTGIMTHQLYREINYLTESVSNVWFNWNSRPVPKSMTLEKADKYVKDKQELTPLWCEKSEWLTITNSALNEINSGRFESIQKLKEFKSFPTIEFVTLDPETGFKKKIRFNATTPFILFSQEKNILPQLSKLGNFEAKENNKKFRYSNSKNKLMICSQLNLVGVIKKHVKKQN